MLKFGLIILLFSISFSSQACQIIQSNVKDDYYIGETCSLFPLGSTEAKLTPDTVYFVQYLYTNSFNTYIDIKGDIQNQLTFPTANQPFNHGYRMMIGPLDDLDNAQYVFNQLKKMNYTDVLIKSYTPETPPQSLVLSDSDTQAPQDVEVLTYPNMTPVYSFGAYTALLPTYNDEYEGKITRYNERNIGSFTYQQAKAICHAANSRIANEQDYRVMLSNMSFLMKYAVKSQFWLKPNETITRIQDKVQTRPQNPNAYFNVICMTK